MPELMKDLVGLLAYNLEYISISNYQPLSGNSYMNLPVELRRSKNGLINIKEKDQKYFLWCHFRHINPSKEHPEIILKKLTKKILKSLIMIELSFPCKKKILARLKKRKIYALMCLVIKMGWFFQFTFQIKIFKNQ